MNQQEQQHLSSIDAAALWGDAASHPEVAAFCARLNAAEREREELRAALETALERERSIRQELHHRVRNLVAVIRSILRRTLEGDTSQEQFAEHFEGRLDAVARYQAEGIGPGEGIELEDVLRNELLEFQCLDGPDCSIAGPPVRLHHKELELMGLAIHELATNSIKFGALSSAGHLAIDWSLDDAGARRMLRFCWCETGVAMVAAAPRARGFGRRFLEDALPYQLGASVSFDLRPGGLECVVLLPLGAADGAG